MGPVTEGDGGLALRPGAVETSDTMSRSHPAPFLDNRGTLVALPNRAKISFQEVFSRVFPELDGLMSGLPGDGLLLVAVFAGQRIEAHLHVPLAEPSPVPLAAETGPDQEFVTIGRHTSCDLRLECDEAVSLRHLVVGIRPSRGGLRLRLCDLATGVGLRTEDGFGCEALASEGAAFVSVGDYQLLLLPTGHLAPLPWAAPAANAWAAIPERVYFDKRTTSRAGRYPASVRLQPVPQGRSITTQIVDPPMPLRQKRPPPGTRGPRIGSVLLTASGLRERYDVHAADLDRGVLIGRYERCAFGAEDDRLSRVHLMLLRDGDQIWAIDTASSNGTTADGTAIRQVRLTTHTQLDLADAVTFRWTADDPEGVPPPSLIDTPLDDLLRRPTDPPKR
jgi:pSer/pThr/pTyr-binding forkhead associated (FHA) protein